MEVKACKDLVFQVDTKLEGQNIVLNIKVVDKMTKTEIDMLVMNMLLDRTMTI